MAPKHGRKADRFQEPLKVSIVHSLTRSQTKLKLFVYHRKLFPLDISICILDYLTPLRTFINKKDVWKVICVVPAAERSINFSPVNAYACVVWTAGEWDLV